MKALFGQRYNRAQIERISRDRHVFGSTHYRVKARHRWSPLRLLFGDLRYVFYHPAYETCNCYWRGYSQHPTKGDRLGRIQNG